MKNNNLKNIFPNGKTLCLDNILVSYSGVSCRYVDAELYPKNEDDSSVLRCFTSINEYYCKECSLAFNTWQIGDNK